VRSKAILAGIVVLVAAYVVSQITASWVIAGVTILTFHPLTAFALVLYIVGGIIIVMGITKNVILQISLSFLVILGVLYMYQVPLPMMVRL